MFWAGPFRYCTNVDAKLGELAPLTHKFAKEVTSENFTMNAPDPLRWTQNSCFGVFWTVSLLHECAYKTGRTCAINAQVCWTKLRRNLSQQTHQIHSIGPKTHDLGRFKLFRYFTKVDAKLVELVPLTHKFAEQSRIRIFHDKRTWSTPLDPKLMF
jgi:hypothetical protein